MHALLNVEYKSYFDLSVKKLPLDRMCSPYCNGQTVSLKRLTMESIESETENIRKILLCRWQIFPAKPFVEPCRLMIAGKKNSIKQTIQGEVWPMLDTTTQQHCGYVITALIKTLQAKIHPSLCTIKVAHGNKSNWMILPHSRSDNCFVDLLVHADNSLVFKQK